MILQIDGRFVHSLESPVVKAVIIPGKLVNLLTRIPDPEKQITITQRGGKVKIKIGKLAKAARPA